MHPLLAELIYLCIRDFNAAIVYDNNGYRCGVLDADEIAQLPNEFMALINEIRRVNPVLPTRGEIYDMVVDDCYFKHIQGSADSGVKSYAIFSLVDKCMGMLAVDEGLESSN